jgi:peptidoglycan/LPS O-acetylase OafA/YrhL
LSGQVFLAYFGPLVIAAAVLGGGCALVAGLALTAFRRMVRAGADPDGAPVQQAARTVRVSVLIACACTMPAFAFPLLALTTRGWLQLVELIVAVAVVALVATRTGRFLERQAKALKPHRRRRMP